MGPAEFPDKPATRCVMTRGRVGRRGARDVLTVLGNEPVGRSRAPVPSPPGRRLAVRAVPMRTPTGVARPSPLAVLLQRSVRVPALLKWSPRGGAVSPGKAALRYHETVRQFKRRLLAHTLLAYGGNRTHSARALGLQRTYFVRLLRQLKVDAPRPGSRRRSRQG